MESILNKEDLPVFGEVHMGALFLLEQYPATVELVSSIWREMVCFGRIALEEDHG